MIKKPRFYSSVTLHVRQKCCSMIFLHVFFVPKDIMFRHVWREFAGWWSSAIFLRNHPDVVRRVSAAQTNVLDADFFGFSCKLCYLCATAGKSGKVEWKGLFSCNKNTHLEIIKQIKILYSL